MTQQLVFCFDEPPAPPPPTRRIPSAKPAPDGDGFDNRVLETLLDGLALLRELASGTPEPLPPSLDRLRSAELAPRGERESLCRAVTELRELVKLRDARIQSLEATIRTQHKALQVLVQRLEPLASPPPRMRPAMATPASQPVRHAVGT